MSEQSPAEFIEKTLGQLNLYGLVCGFDFHYGFKGAGNCESLQNDAPYEVRVVEAVEDETGKISSTRISAAIEQGNMEEAARMLGYEYQIDGTVIHGRHIGTGMGFPTANVGYSTEYILPKKGVYACYAKIGGKKIRAMVNIGHNPTVNYTDRMSLEAHLIDFKGDIYGRMITVSFIRYLRPEMKFRNADNLVMQLDQDLRDTNRILDAYEQSFS
jgi:riboflavin kinase/FMN adenylyltransferase